MRSGLTVLLGCTFLTACSVASWQSIASDFSFDWQLEGDPQVAPLQVFGDQRETWLQFAPGQPVPALFADTANGEQPIAYIHRAPYVVVDGQWRSLTFRGGHRQARAWAPQTVRSAEQGLTGSFGRATLSSKHATDTSGSIAKPAVKPVVVAASVAKTESVSAQNVVTPTLAASPAAVAYLAGPPDLTLRAVLMRWARQSNWIFGAEHWVVDADIPLQGQARFDGEFKTAVRGLLATTELADRPLQPCFYANRVLRVVPIAQACDRSATSPGKHT